MDTYKTLYTSKNSSGTANWNGKRAVIYELDKIIHIVRAKNRDKEIQALIDGLYDMIINEWNEEAKEAYKELLEMLYNEELTIEEAEKILSDNFGEGFATKFNDIGQTWVNDVYKIGVEEVAEQVKFEVKYDLKDSKAINLMHEQNIFFVSKYWDEQRWEYARKIIEQVLVEGRTIQDVANGLAEFMDAEGKIATNYFYAFVEHSASRIRNVGHITGYEKAGIEYAQVVATMDLRTTEICREMNGRLIPVKVMSQVKQAYLSIDPTDKTYKQVKQELERVTPFWNDKDTEKIKGLPTQKIVSKHSGLAMPPYHWRCRTRTIAYFAPDKTIDVKQGKDIKNDIYLKNLTNEEILNKLEYFQKLKRDLPFNEIDFKSDIIKHGQKEFGISTPSEYTKLANLIRKRATKFLIRTYKGDLQFYFYCDEPVGYTIVSTRGEIRGCYGYSNKASMDKAFNDMKQRFYEVNYD